MQKRNNAAKSISSSSLTSNEPKDRMEAGTDRPSHADTNRGVRLFDLHLSVPPPAWHIPAHPQPAPLSPQLHHTSVYSGTQRLLLSKAEHQGQDLPGKAARSHCSSRWLGEPREVVVDSMQGAPHVRLQHANTLFILFRSVLE